MGVFRLMHGLVLLVALTLAGTAGARTLNLGNATCVGGAASAQEAFALDPASLDCGPGRFDRVERFVRIHSLVDAAAFPVGEPLVWQTDPSAFRSLLLRFTYADGSRRLVDVDPQMAVRNWMAGNRFFVPIPSSEAPPVEIDAVVEFPQTRATMRNTQLVDEISSAREHYFRSLIYVLICGLLIVPIMYDILFYRVLRARFMVWHLAMTTMMLIFVLSSSGLIFLLFPELPLMTRWHINTCSLSLTIAAAAMFAIRLLEERILPGWLLRTLLVSTGAMLVTKCVALLGIEALRIVIVPYYLASLLPIAVSILLLIVIGLSRNSRAATYLAIGFSGLLLTALMNVMARAELLQPSFSLDDMLYAGLVILALGTTAGTGDRFMVMRRERDLARDKAMRMGQMANTDGLTGLLNRRAFDKLSTLAPGRGFLLADIDRFKSINDAFGHQVGDAVLCQAARLMRTAVPRNGSRVYRLGGEEFAIVVRVDDAEELGEVAEAVRRSIERDSENRQGPSLPAITISMGCVLGVGQTMREAIAVADRALYEAKRQGRNRWAIRPPTTGEAGGGEDIADEVCDPEDRVSPA